MGKLISIEIEGFKSIGKRESIRFGDVTVFLGANGAGKSNLVSFFKMLNYMTTEGLQQYIGKNGQANSILHFGSQRTKNISFTIHFKEGNWKDSYTVDLAFGMPDALFIAGEKIVAHQEGREKPLKDYIQSQGRSESGLRETAAKQNSLGNSAKVIRSLLSRCRVFQFHDTSETARIRNSCYVEDADYLKSDGGNLPAFLYAMKNSNPKYYQRIVDHIRTMVPQFQDFHLKPSSTNAANIFLNWGGECGDDYLFGPHQLSDGSIRYMALTALLLQPKETLPDVIILDEPELGLHPAALESLSGMISIAKQNCQVVLATQSPELANQFTPEDIVIVNYDKQEHQSTFKRLDTEGLKEWINDYSVSELWMKNVIGGRP